MIERIPPHNEEAERSVLGAAMLNKEVLFDILEPSGSCTAKTARSICSPSAKN